MRNREDILAALARLKPQLEEEYGVHSVALFGSVARGDVTDKSDIDIMVNVDPTIGMRFVTLASELESSLGSKVDLVSSRAVKPKALELISEDAIYVE